MGARITFESDQAKVEVDAPLQLVRLIWKGNATGEAYRAPCFAVLKAVEELGVKHFLSDTRLMGPILFADRSWSEKEVIPKLIAAGLKRIAIVSSTDGLNVIAVDNMVNTIPMGTAIVAFFESPSAAEKWLFTKDTTDASVPERRKGI